MHTRPSCPSPELLALGALVLLAVAAVGMGPVEIEPSASLPSTVNMIVQSSDVEAAASLVTSVGGRITHELAIIDGVAADLTAAQLEALEVLPVRIHPSSEVQGSTAPTLAATRTIAAEGHNGPR